MLNIESLLNKQVSIIGSKDFNNGNIEENRYYSANKKDVVSFTRFNFVSIREAWGKAKTTARTLSLQASLLRNRAC